MIFSSKNEKGVPLWKLVLSGEKTVTRRRHPVSVGNTLAVQKKRGTKSIGRVVVLSCVDNEEWCDANLPKEAEPEAAREGFASWNGLWAEINRIYGGKIPTLYRIEFKKKTGASAGGQRERRHLGKSVG